MIGNQICNNLFQFFIAMRYNCKNLCCDRNKHDEEEQWEKDNDLNDFNSNTLIDEYLDLG
jgi:hypothetical protein